VSQLNELGVTPADFNTRHLHRQMVIPMTHA